MSSHREEKENKRTHILNIAEEVFSEKGYDGARVDEIARRAEVNKALLYYYFESKNNLLKEVIKRQIDAHAQIRSQMWPDIDAIAKDGLEKGLKQIITDTFYFVHHAEDVFRIMLSEIVKSEPESDTIFELLQQMLSGIDERTKKLGIKFESDDHLHQTAFFFVLIPSIAFVVLKEKWTDYYHLDPNTVQNNFIKVLSEIYGGYLERQKQSD